MPHSLRAKLSGLRYKGILEDKDYKRLCHALDLEKAEQEPTNKSNLEKICEELAAENDDLRDQLAMRDRFKQEPCDLLIIKSDKYLHPDDRKKWMEKIKREKERGVIILPPCFEPLLVPNDIEIRIEQEPCDDVVSRQAVLDIVNNPLNIRLDEIIKKLPSVRPQQKIVQCSQCKYAEVADSEDSQDGFTCQFHRGSIWFSGSYCSWAERRQDG